MAVALLSHVVGPLLLLHVAKAWMEEGFTDGVDGGRYSLFQDDVKPADDVEAKKAAEDIKCTVCEVILGNLIGDVGMLDNEDQILTLLEGEPSQEEVDAAIAQRDQNLVNLARGRKGCNRHFKDSFLRKGWDVEGCIIHPPHSDEPPKKRPPWLTVYGTCTKSGQPVQNETKMNTYSTRMEAIYWACQLTVGNHMDSLAKFLSKKLSAEGAVREHIIKEGCEKKAKCKQLKYQGTYSQREKEADEQWKKQQSDALESTKKSIKAKEKEDKKRGRRSKSARVGTAGEL